MSTKLRRTRLRGRALLLIMLVVVAALAALWWFWWVPNWRPVLGGDETYGIDVSAHQGTIEWRAVASNDITFAYIKATEGGDFVDDRFDTNWTEAGEAGLKRGAYHFFTLCRPGDEQAQNFLRVASPDRQALPPAVDLELAGNCSARPQRNEVYSELRTFLEMVEEAWGGATVLYVGNDWEGLYPVKEWLGRPLWLRRFLLRPHEQWHIWQLHGYANVTGVEGGVDLNVMNEI